MRRWNGVSSRSWSISRRSRTPSRSCAVCASATKCITACASRMPPWWPPRCCPIAISRIAFCRIRPSISSMRPLPSCAPRSTVCRPSWTRSRAERCSWRSSAKRSKKEKDAASKERLAKIEKELAELKGESDTLQGAVAGREGGRAKAPRLCASRSSRPKSPSSRPSGSTI